MPLAIAVVLLALALKISLGQSLRGNLIKVEQYREY